MTENNNKEDSGFNIKEFSDRLKTALEEKNMEQKKLAQKIGVTTATMNNYVWGVSRPSLTVVYSIAKELGVSVDYLLGLSDYLELENKDAEEAKILARDMRDIPESERKVIKEMVETLKRKHHKRTIIFKKPW